MGDRAQLQITNGTRSVFLYTHWEGEMLEARLRRGLTAGRPLDEDPSYCLGTILKEFFRPTLDTETGSGVGFAYEDNDDDRGAPLVLNVQSKTVSYKKRRVSVQAFCNGATVGWTARER